MEHSAHARHYSRYWEHSKEERRVKSLLGAYILVEKREDKQEMGTECCWWTWQCAPERDQKEERTPEWMRLKLGTSEGGVGTVWLWGTEDKVEEAWREQVQGGTVSGQRPRDGGLGGTWPAVGSRG